MKEILILLVVASTGYVLRWAALLLTCPFIGSVEDNRENVSQVYLMHLAHPQFCV
jgi:hypothetical protein